MESGSVVTKNDLIKCKECGSTLDILNEYDYYDLNRYFVKECCGYQYILAQNTYIYTCNEIKMDLEKEFIEQ